MFKYKPNLKRRIFATLIDYGLYLLCFIAYVEWFGHPNAEGGKTVNGILALPLPLVWFLYFVCVEAFNGATLGHIALNLRVVTADRKAIDFSDALKRHLLDFIDILFYGIPAIIAIRKSEKHQRLGDMWADTIVIDMTDPEQYHQLN